MRPMIKLLNQFEQVAKATPFALREDGNISDGIAQGTCADVGVSLWSGIRSNNLKFVYKIVLRNISGGR